MNIDKEKNPFGLVIPIMKKLNSKYKSLTKYVLSNNNISCIQNDDENMIVEFTINNEKFFVIFKAYILIGVAKMETYRLKQNDNSNTYKATILPDLSISIGINNSKKSYWHKDDKRKNITHKIWFEELIKHL